MKSDSSNLFNHNNLVLFLLAICFCNSLVVHGQNEVDGPNFIIIFADDLGYGDLGSYGHPSIATPNLDKLAEEGQKWTNFYAAASVCTPSRASILTGRLSVRSGMTSHKRRVLFPDSKYGLPRSEITLAEKLREAGYRTACIGKWHLGHKERYLPTNNGFDYYFGIPYSNDMDRVGELDSQEYWSQPDSLITTENFNVPLLRNTEIIERPANQNTITKRYSEEAVSFIKRSNGEPFFLYLAHSLPHVPLFASERFIGKSRRGLYGDVVEEIDHGIGLILKTLKEEGLYKNTVVVFTSDNGPWLTFKKNGGSAGLLRAGKGTTWEGGMRVPGIFWGPGIVKPGTRYDIGSTMDLYTTFISMAGIDLPEDRIIDGFDISQTLQTGKPSSRKQLFYYRGTDIYALRYGAYKAHFITEGAYGEFGGKETHNPPLLYNLAEDPSETTNIADKHPDILKEILTVLDRHKANLVPGPDQMTARDKRP
ncbi:MAG: sulfatase family protein [Flavobacteriaceae bacterium]